MLDRARIAELRDEVGADDMAEVVGLFCEEFQETLDRLQATTPTPDDLHFLKGSAVNIGMTEVAALCHAAEQRLRTAAGATTDLSGISQAFQAARNALDREVSA